MPIARSTTLAPKRSHGANNRQNFAGFSAQLPFYNVTTVDAMWAGRFGLGILALALAAMFAAHGRKPVTLGTMPTVSPLFAMMVTGTALIVGALSYVPVLALGPVVEHLLLRPYGASLKPPA